MNEEAVGFFDRRCERGHRYGWTGKRSDDPGCDKCRTVPTVLDVRPLSGSRRDPSTMSLDEMVEEGIRLTGARRDDVLRIAMAFWIRAKRR